ncbi:MAG: DNA repair protein RecN [Eubacteriales bacterium]|nr:DNA repair protein RecN [Eubacteriales bacterium]
MIDHISIKDFAIIKDAEIDFDEGLNIITGETGAGKSIIIEAVSLVLGSRADSSFIRHGCAKAIVGLTATVDGEEYVISREITAAGKNLCRLNGRLATVAEVAAAASKIAAIHGQYDNQALLDPDNHIKLVDDYGKAEITPLKDDFTAAYNDYKQKRKALEKLVADEKESRRNANVYRFQIGEIESVAPVPGEDEELSNSVELMKNSEKIYDSLHTAGELINDGETNVLTMIGEALEELNKASRYSEEISQLAERWSGVYYDAQDIGASVKELSDMLSFSPDELDASISRLNSIDDLKKKYGPEISDVLEYAETIKKKLALTEDFSSEKEALDKASKAALAVLREKAEALTEARTRYAGKLSQAILNELKELNFKDAELEMQVRKAPAISQNGSDECEIMISTNKGEPLKPLVKTASGGEISRIMLAIRNVTGEDARVSSMIFDEIDTGISGVTASVVAKKLREISGRHQIICITHLPQIAAAGTSNYMIYKDSDSDSTYTHVLKLGESEKEQEIARLLGGDHVTETTVKSARELIENYK